MGRAPTMRRYLAREGGVELPWAFAHWILSSAGPSPHHVVIGRSSTWAAFAPGQVRPALSVCPGSPEEYVACLIEWQLWGPLSPREVRRREVRRILIERPSLVAQLGCLPSDNAVLT